MIKEKNCEDEIRVSFMKESRGKFKWGMWDELLVSEEDILCKLSPPVKSGSLYEMSLDDREICWHRMLRLICKLLFIYNICNSFLCLFVWYQNTIQKSDTIRNTLFLWILGVLNHIWCRIINEI